MKQYLSAVLATLIIGSLIIIIMVTGNDNQYGIIDHGAPPVRMMANMDDSEAEYTADTMYAKTGFKSVQGNDNWLRITFRANAAGVYVLRGDNVNADTAIDTTVNDSTVEEDSAQ